VLYAILAAPTDFAMVDAMLKAGADLNAPRQNGRTTLHALVSAPLRNKTACTRTADEAQICVAETLEQRARIMRYLVERGADPAQPDKNGTSALDAARKLSDEQRRLAYVGALSPKP
jgi:ankyrin repeat protein